MITVVIIGAAALFLLIRGTRSLRHPFEDVSGRSSSLGGSGASTGASQPAQDYTHYRTEPPIDESVHEVSAVVGIPRKMSIPKEPNDKIDTDAPIDDEDPIDTHVEHNVKVS